MPPKVFDPLLNPETSIESDSEKKSYGSSPGQLDVSELPAPKQTGRGRSAPKGLGVGPDYIPAGRKRKANRCSKLLALLLKLLLVLLVFALFGWNLYLSLDNPDELPECPEPLREWMFATSIGGLAVVVNSLLTSVILWNTGERCMERCEAIQWPRISLGLSVLATLTALITGAVWVYSIEDESVCPELIFNFMWYEITVCWGLLAALLVIVCCLGCCLLIRY